MNEPRSEICRSACLGLFIGLGITALLSLLVGCSPDAQAQTTNGIANPLMPPLVAVKSSLIASTPITPTIYKRGSVSLKWDASPDLSVAGYRVYWGGISGVYTNAVRAGTNTTAKLEGLDEGVKYYFTVSAYDAIGIESPFSNEVSFTTAIYISLTMKIWSVEAYGMPGKTNMIRSSTNLMDWWTILTWVGNGSATNVLHTNTAACTFRVEVK